MTGSTTNTRQIAHALLDGAYAMTTDLTDAEVRLALERVTQLEAASADVRETAEEVRVVVDYTSFVSAAVGIIHWALDRISETEAIDVAEAVGDAREYIDAVLDSSSGRT